MTPDQIVTLATAACEAIKAACQFAATPQGQALIEQSLKDRAKWDQFWKDIGDGLGGWFKELAKK